MLEPASVAEFLEGLPCDRRDIVNAVRKTIKDNINEGFEEGIQYGGIGYFVPHSIYPNGYHCNPKEPLPFVGVGNTKGHVCIYLFCIYTNESTVDAFRKDWIATGKRLDMGKSCVRVKKIQDLAMDVLGKTIKSISLKDFLAQYKSGKNHGKGLQKTKVKSSSRKEPEIKNMKVKHTAKKATGKPAGKLTKGSRQSTRLIVKGSFKS